MKLTNWSQEECNKSRLRRVLPVRRGRRGCRPGMKGAGPRGRTKGDQEQWCFPDVTLEEWERREILGEVVSLATKAMFNNHFYKFGGRSYHQAQGGPIGLRGTCAVARLVMQLWDRMWLKRIEVLGIRVWLLMRYVDDARAALPPIRAGWRWQDGSLTYCKRWEQEDSAISGEQRTREILGATMNGVEDFLDFTVESGEQFPGGWLPTLDTNLRVGEQNKIEYKFYEKETTTRRTVQRRTAMEENVKVKIVSNDLVRRLCNSMEELGSNETNRVVDGYAQKLLNSGYSREQTRSILVNGIKGYEGRKAKCLKLGRSVKRKAKDSLEDRTKKVLLSKSSWYKGRGKKDHYGSRKGGSRRGKEQIREECMEQKSVLFVEHTKDGELSRRLREVIGRMAPMLGFSIKVVERSGRTLKSCFPQSSLWEGVHCGRPQ